jgi:hypothetical protein
MKYKSIIFFVAIAVSLMGCNKEKEEGVSISTSTDQQEEAVTTASDSVPIDTKIVIPDRQVIPQMLQEAAVIPPQEETIANLPAQTQPIQDFIVTEQLDMVTSPAPQDAIVSTEMPADSSMVITDSVKKIDVVPADQNANASIDKQKVASPVSTEQQNFDDSQLTSTTTTVSENIDTVDGQAKADISSGIEEEIEAY